MSKQVSIAFGLALLGPAEHGIEFLNWLVWQQGAKKYDDVADGRQINVKIAARETEDQRNLVDFADDCVGAHAF